jgi:adenylate kinase
MKVECEKCGGSGFNREGTGYDAVCDCTGGYVGAVKRCIIIFGPPGCGKGTEADLLHHHIFYISTGLMLRRAGYDLSTGQLISDDVVNQIVMDGIVAASDSADILLDGYPRTVAQAEYLRDHLKAADIPTLVFHFHVEDQEVLVKRMLNRNQGRSDDVEHVIRERLRVYERETYPALQILQDAFGVYPVDASRDPLTVHKEVWNILTGQQSCGGGKA